MSEQNASKRTLVAVLVPEELNGSLNSVVEFLSQLKERYSRDYLDLTIEPSVGLPSIELTGVRNYSDETQTRLQQFRDLVKQLPEEAVNEILRSCGEDSET